MGTPQYRLARVAGRDAWHVVWHDNATRRISTGCASRAEAEIFLAEFIRQQNAPTGNTVTNLIDAYVADRKKVVSNPKRFDWTFKPIKKFFGALLPDQITKPMSAGYAATREGRAPGTIRAELTMLAAAMNWAVSERLIATAPPIVLPSPPPPREKVVSADVVEKIATAAPAAHIAMFARLAYHTAARRAAILDPTWERVDFERRLIDLNPPGRIRTAKARATTPINDALLPHLKEAFEFRTCDYVVAYAGEKIASVKTGWREACARAGVKGVTPHVLRHSAATEMASRGVPLMEIAAYLGHSDSRTTERVYVKYTPGYLKGAAKALAEAAQESKRGRVGRGSGKASKRAKTAPKRQK